ncbi:methyltransferase domain-containing protein [Nocardia sp. NPDC051052]|uniref:methyltransferase domain-containing protein n=1 Tax=Nocardia sp. NPDC051052 TaxID=3364322 RepID=UPI0037890191
MFLSFVDPMLVRGHLSGCSVGAEDVVQLLKFRAIPTGMPVFVDEVTMEPIAPLCSWFRHLAYANKDPKTLREYAYITRRFVHFLESRGHGLATATESDLVAYWAWRTELQQLGELDGILYRKMNSGHPPTMPHPVIGKSSEVSVTDSLGRSRSGLFTGTAWHYARYRPGYPRMFFDDLVQRFHLDGTGRLLDLGCGTGQLTLPLAEHVVEAVGMDPEPEMVVEAARQAQAAQITNATWVHGNSAGLPGELGRFRLVTMGRSFHWMDLLSASPAPPLDDAGEAFYSRLIAPLPNAGQGQNVQGESKRDSERRDQGEGQRAHRIGMCQQAQYDRVDQIDHTESGPHQEDPATTGAHHIGSDQRCGQSDDDVAEAGR